MKKSKRILVCPLDWGIGHATRIVPIINILLENDFEVVIAADKRPLSFLKSEFHNLQFVKFKGYNISYPEKGSMILKMIFSLPKIIFKIIYEHRKLKKIILKHQIDIVFSDNRFGLWNKNIPSIFMTHQIMIKTPGNSPYLEKILYKINQSIIKKYDECWIPDNKEIPNLSGDLSHKFTPPKKSFYIGSLSRFNNKAPIKPQEKKINILAIISGPEPQRSIFEEIIISQLKKLNLKSVIVSGMPGNENPKNKFENLEIFSHLESKKLLEYILNSKIIICRPGYSSLMDLAALNKKAIFVPTPGQTEQEYLAKYLSDRKLFYSVKQKDLDIKKAIEHSDKFSSLSMKNDYSLLKERIEYWKIN